eukprot:Clim_evm66s214 gene=Clim_evmTU66s214
MTPAKQRQLSYPTRRQPRRPLDKKKAKRKTMDCATIVEKIRYVFRSNDDNLELTGRDKEKKSITDFIDQQMNTFAVGLPRQTARETSRRSTPGACDPADSHVANQALYISGLPGVGKSATLKCLWNEGALENTEHIFLNCKGFERWQSLSVSIVAWMQRAALSSASESGGPGCGRSRKRKQKDTSDSIAHLHTTNVTERNVVAFMEDYINAMTGRWQRPLFVVLDEMDQLSEKGLLTIFDWATLSQSPLRLIGIANGLDLTERLLPRLQARGIAPATLTFAAYNRQGIRAILDQHLQQVVEQGRVSQEQILGNDDLDWVCQQVAKHTGDARLAIRLIAEAAQVRTGVENKENAANDGMAAITRAMLSSAWCMATGQALAPTSCKNRTALQSLAAAHNAKGTGSPNQKASLKATVSAASSIADTSKMWWNSLTARQRTIVAALAVHSDNHSRKGLPGSTVATINSRQAHMAYERICRRAKVPPSAICGLSEFIAVLQGGHCDAAVALSKQRKANSLVVEFRMRPSQILSDLESDSMVRAITTLAISKADVPAL